MAQVHGRDLRRFQANDSGAALVEFAMVGPILLVMLMGIVTYGGYFWMSHAVQQVANDAARAAVAGLDGAERNSLAQSSLTASIGGYPFLEAAEATAVVTSDATQMQVQVSYDASDSPFWALSGLLPLPGSTIERHAAIRLGGY